ncbi:MAG: PEP-CTERM sorting domain-containing protein [Propionivibrio sp.]|uniref:PEP-CTERM sorting domain-containing protein n=1 Tax=Propionivibrio sp. TaxID=2212460 RepID=UPI001A3E6762|nr:PEP-CTERM sorting domain-containing protein [Propionivibrio sp.]MBL8415029.1 PEP-CTERM sorting domain-containing protein [Propionivibrio sp.]
MKRLMFNRAVSVCRATFFASLLLTGLSTSALGGPQVFATSYDLKNGDGNAGYGNVTLFDDTYNGSGSKTVGYAALSSGLGDLTDGFAAVKNWGDCGGARPCVSGPAYDNSPYVGWRMSSLATPSVTFHFTPGTNIDEVKISMNYGYHASPLGFLMGGVSLSQGADPTYTGGGANHWYDFAGLGLSGDTLKITFNYNREPRTTAHPFGPADWVLVSEVQFFAATPAIPEPSTNAMLLAGLGLLGIAARRTKLKTA